MNLILIPLYVFIFSCSASPTRRDVLQELIDHHLTTFVDLALRADLSPELTEGGPFTIFAPTNEALSSFSSSVLYRIISKPKLLRKILTYHIVPERTLQRELHNEATAPTLYGGHVRINKYGNITTVNGVSLKSDPIYAKNGVVWVIDKLLVPDVDRSILQILSTDARFTTFVITANASGLLSFLDSADPKTIFAPTNKAFLALPDQFMADPEALRSLILDHVSWGTKYFLGLSSGTITSVNGNSVESAISKDGGYIGGSKILQIDLSASNGVIHVIDKIFLPEAQRGDTLQMNSAPSTAPTSTIPIIPSTTTLVAITSNNWPPTETIPTTTTEAVSELASSTQSTATFEPTNIVTWYPTGIASTTTQATILPDIITILSNDARFSMLAEAAAAAGLIPILEAAGPFTVFAPTNDAFARLPDGYFQGLLADTDQLQNLLLGHVVLKQVLSKDLTAPDLFSASGKLALSIDGVEVIESDMLASNGVVHAVSSIISPEFQDITGIISSDRRLSNLIEAAVVSGFVSLTSSRGPITLFAPTNEAFAALPSGLLGDLLYDPKQMENILLRHAVLGKLMSSDLASGDINSINGESTHAEVSDDGITFGGAKVVKLNVFATNGVVHFVDKFVLPEMRITSSAEPSLVEVKQEAPVAAPISEIISASQADIVAVLESHPQLSKLSEALAAANLISTLQSSGPYTVFAPTNEAFAALPKEYYEKIHHDPEELKKLLLGHVLAKRISSKDSTYGNVELANGQSARLIVSRSKISIKDIPTSENDIAASNGIVHIVNKVIFPDSKSSSILDILLADPRFTTIVDAAAAAGLDQFAETSGPFTIFVPTDDAFAEVPADVLDKLLQDLDKLRKLLFGYVIMGNAPSGDLTTKKWRFLNGQSLPAGDGSTIGNAKIIEADVEARNGIIMVLDKMIWPLE